MITHVGSRCVKDLIVVIDCLCVAITGQMAANYGFETDRDHFRIQDLNGSFTEITKEFDLKEAKRHIYNHRPSDFILNKPCPKQMFLDKLDQFAELTGESHQVAAYHLNQAVPRVPEKYKGKFQSQSRH